MTEISSYFPAEWETQSGVQLTWPDTATDWKRTLIEVLSVYEQIAKEILKHEKLLIVCRDKNSLPDFLQNNNEQLTIQEMPINDTWARDHGAITIIENGQPALLNFRFNGWGMKFPANHDNQITSTLYQQKAFREGVRLHDLSYFTFEGGAIESNGTGCALTTSECLLSKNRNEHLSQTAIEFLLKKTMYIEKVLWLHHGFLAGDDTDSHIDTLARFCNKNTIAYVKCTNTQDLHYDALQKMEVELKQMTDQNGQPFQLVPLPFPDPIYDNDGEQLPATYANFLILNKAVLLPVYEIKQDFEAIEITKKLFPEHEIVPINSRPLIKQHGSIHCISMQFPIGVL
ncbi:agmatine deiminase family protein [uncultured Sunxiuqinia sp.]|uniref:agmatine deiminase family protein n=1 Tax=uncultured Sunxiuqinia sp. TaxID=1573825 RepID=UPI002AA79CBA|nr:agmatine deiminase family protein [uncultured Sunxiuqinia sp.]